MRAKERKALDGLDPVFIMCRDIGHAWSPGSIEEDGKVYVRSLGCGRCTTDRRDVVGRNGTTLRRTYRYPKGYLMPKGVRLARREVRREALIRLITRRG